MKMNSSTGLIIKVIALLLALAGVFWARTALREVVTTPATEQAPIPAKVEIGK